MEHSLPRILLLLLSRLFLVDLVMLLGCSKHPSSAEDFWFCGCFVLCWVLSSLWSLSLRLFVVLSLCAEAADWRDRTGRSAPKKTPQPKALTCLNFLRPFLTPHVVLTR